MKNFQDAKSFPKDISSASEFSKTLTEALTVKKLLHSAERTKTFIPVKLTISSSSTPDEKLFVYPEMLAISNPSSVNTDSLLYVLQQSREGNLKLLLSQPMDIESIKKQIHIVVCTHEVSLVVS